MSQAFLKLIESSKFWTTVIGVLATLGAKYGINVDAATQAEIVGLFVMLLAGQASADHGKAAAAIAAAPTPVVAAQVGSSTQSGRATTVLLFALAVGVIAVTLLAASGCGTLGHDVIVSSETCAKTGAGAATDALIADVEAILRDGSPTWQKELDALASQGEGLGESTLFCAVETALADLQKHLGGTSASSDAISNASLYLNEHHQPAGLQ